MILKNKLIFMIYYIIVSYALRLSFYINYDFSSKTLNLKWVFLSYVSIFNN